MSDRVVVMRRGHRGRHRRARRADARARAAPGARRGRRVSDATGVLRARAPARRLPARARHGGRSRRCSCSCWSRPPRVLHSRQPARPRRGERAGADHRHRHDARAADRPRRHLGRLALRGLLGCGRAARARRPADAAGARRRSSCSGAALGAMNGLFVARLRTAVGRRDAGDDGDLARRAEVGDRRRVGAGPARRVPVVRAAAAYRRVGDRAGRSWRCCWRARTGCASLAAGRAIYAVGSDPEAARLVGPAPRRVVLGVFTALGDVHGTGGGAELDPVLGGAGQRRRRPRDQGARGGGRRRHADHRRPRHARRHARRRGAARRARHGAHVSGHQPVLGEGGAGRHHPARLGGRCAGRPRRRDGPRDSHERTHARTSLARALARGPARDAGVPCSGWRARTSARGAT